MPDKKPEYIPAMRVRWLTPLYDPLLRVVAWEKPYRRRLNQLLDVKGGETVLDLGCGTGTQIVTLKQDYPAVNPVGLDFDRDILWISQRKIKKGNLDIPLVQASAVMLPFATSSFDRVMTSMVFHHLSTENKRLGISEAFRVLKPGGLFSLADFGKPANRFMSALAGIIGHLERTDDNVKGRLPAWMTEVGFTDVAEKASFGSVVGTISAYVGRKPG